MSSATVIVRAGVTMLLFMLYQKSGLCYTSMLYSDVWNVLVSMVFSNCCLLFWNVYDVSQL